MVENFWLPAVAAVAMTRSQRRWVGFMHHHEGTPAREGWQLPPAHETLFEGKSPPSTFHCTTTFTLKPHSTYPRTTPAPLTPVYPVKLVRYTRARVHRIAPSSTSSSDSAATALERDTRDFHPRVRARPLRVFNRIYNT